MKNIVTFSEYTDNEILLMLKNLYSTGYKVIDIRILSINKKIFHKVSTDMNTTSTYELPPVSTNYSTGYIIYEEDPTFKKHP